MPACTEAQWGVLACTGMPWRVTTMTGEALGSAELRVPTSDRFTRWAPFLTCREMRRCHWSLECPQSQQGMGGPNWPPVPTLAPQFQDLPQCIHLCLLLRPPAEAEQRFSLDWPLWGLGGHRCPQAPGVRGEIPSAPPSPTPASLTRSLFLQGPRWGWRQGEQGEFGASKDEGNGVGLGGPKDSELGGTGGPKGRGWGMLVGRQEFQWGGHGG